MPSSKAAVVAFALAALAAPSAVRLMTVIPTPRGLQDFVRDPWRLANDARARAAFGNLTTPFTAVRVARTNDTLGCHTWDNNCPFDDVNASAALRALSACVGASDVHLRVRIEAYEVYDGTPLDQLRDRFLSEDGHARLVVARYDPSSTAAERIAHYNEVRDRCDDGTWSLSFFGEGVVMNEQLVLLESTMLRTEGLTIPLALVVFGLLFRSWHAVLLLAFNVVVVDCLTYGLGAFALTLTTGDARINTGTKPLIESLTLALTIDFTLLLLRRAALERGRTDDLDAVAWTVTTTTGHALTSSAVALVGCVSALALVNPQPYTFQALTLTLVLGAVATTVTKVTVVAFLPWVKPRHHVVSEGARRRLGALLRWPTNLGVVLALTLALLPFAYVGLQTTPTYEWRYGYPPALQASMTTFETDFPGSSLNVMFVDANEPLGADAHSAIGAVAERLLDVPCVDADSVVSVANVGGTALTYDEAVDDRSSCVDDDCAAYRHATRETTSDHALAVVFGVNVPWQSDAHRACFQTLLDVATEANATLWSAGQGPLYQLLDEEARAPLAVVAVVVGVAAAMAVVFRSVLLPLRLVATSFVPLMATYGLMTLLFEDVNGPTMVLALPLIVGLSCDYDILLIRRVRELRWGGATQTDAIVQTISETNTTLAMAALVMCVAFGGMLTMDSLAAVQMGAVLVTSVLVDVTLVRLLLVPCLLSLGERWVWWPSVPPLAAKSREGDAIPLEHLTLL